jgi:hypothetical protein
VFVDKSNLILELEATYYESGLATSANSNGDTYSSCRVIHSDGKVRFSSVQRGISLNLEPNSRFGSGHLVEP